MSYWVEDWTNFSLCPLGIFRNNFRAGFCDLWYRRQQTEDHSVVFINQNVKLDYLRIPSTFKMKEGCNLWSYRNVKIFFSGYILNHSVSVHTSAMPLQ